LPSFLAFISLPCLLAWLLRSFVPCFLPYFLFLFPIFLGIGISSNSPFAVKSCAQKTAEAHKVPDGPWMFAPKINAANTSYSAALQQGVNSKKITPCTEAPKIFRRRKDVVLSP